jgi:two-component system cell cycle response regulator DivK
LHRELVSAVFKDDMYEMLEAHDAITGIKVASEQLPQLIIVDMNMARMSGLEFIKAARVHPDIKHIQIIVVTGQSSASQGYDFLHAGASAYFIKPLNLKPFRRKVKELLGHPMDL